MLRRRGDVEWIALSGSLTGHEIGVEHVGPSTHLRWARKLDSLRYRELPRIRSLREGIEDFREVTPQLWPDSFDAIKFVSEEGQAEAECVAREALLECIRGIRRGGVMLESNPAAAAAEIERWGILNFAFMIAIHTQQLEPEVPLAESDRAPPADGSPVDGGHSGGGE